MRTWLPTWLLVLFVPALASAEWQLSPRFKLGLEERYDDAALFRAEGVMAGQLMTKLMPQVGFNAERRTFSSEGWYAADLFLRHGSGRFTNDHRGFLQMKQELSDRTTMNLSTSLWRVSDPTSLPRIGVARTLDPVFYLQGEAGMQYRVTERWSARLRYRLEGAQVLREGSQFGMVHSPMLDNWYRASRRNDLGLAYRFQYFVFGSQMASSQGVFAGFRRRLTRETVMTLQAGPVFWDSHGAGPSGWLPRATLEVAREGEILDFALAMGHDLVGASGFANAVWADFASLMISADVSRPFRLYGAASLYRNGRPPNQGFVPWTSNLSQSVQGYAVGLGVEWRVSHNFRLQMSGDRISQFQGVAVPGETEFARNIVALRFVWTALQ